MNFKHKLGQAVLGDCLAVMPKIPDASVQLIWTDPPFNTGTRQKHLKGASYSDQYTGTQYLDMLRATFVESHRVLTDSGSLFVLLDYRSVHDAKVLLDTVFAPHLFQGEIIWFSELGASRRHGKGWTVRHCTILWYTKTPSYRFHFDRVPMVPRKAPKPGVRRAEADLVRVDAHDVEHGQRKGSVPEPEAACDHRTDGAGSHRSGRHRP